MLPIHLLMIAVIYFQREVFVELEGVVLLDADENCISSSYDDVSALPHKLVCLLISCRLSSRLIQKSFD